MNIIAAILSFIGLLLMIVAAYFQSVNKLLLALGFLWFGCAAKSAQCLVADERRKSLDRKQ